MALWVWHILQAPSIDKKNGHRSWMLAKTIITDISKRYSDFDPMHGGNALSSRANVFVFVFCVRKRLQRTVPPYNRPWCVNNPLTWCVRVCACSGRSVKWLLDVGQVWFCSAAVCGVYPSSRKCVKYVARTVGKHRLNTVSMNSSFRRLFTYSVPDFTLGLASITNRFHPCDRQFSWLDFFSWVNTYFNLRSRWNGKYT